MDFLQLAKAIIEDKQLRISPNKVATIVRNAANVENPKRYVTLSLHNHERDSYRLRIRSLQTLEQQPYVAIVEFFHTIYKEHVNYCIDQANMELKNLLSKCEIHQETTTQRKIRVLIDCLQQVPAHVTAKNESISMQCLYQDRTRGRLFCKKYLSQNAMQGINFIMKK